MSTIPSVRVIALESKPSNNTSFPMTNNRPTPSSASGISFQTVELLTLKGRISAHIPKIRRIFAILLPTTLPIARSGEPLRAETIFTVNSGADVPNDTTVNPITSAGIPSFFDIEAAPRTNPSAPAIKITSPIIISSTSSIIIIPF